MRTALAGAVLAASLVAALGAYAHGTLPERLVLASRQVAASPEAAEPLLRRADLQRRAGDWGAALADLRQAALRAPNLPALELLRARIYLDRGDPEGSLPPLARLLLALPCHVAALVQQGHALRALERPLDAAGSYAAAAGCGGLADPQLVMDHAGALLDAGEIHTGAALATLDRGIEALGSVPALVRRAVEIEVAAGRLDAACARVDRQLIHTPSSPDWHARRAELQRAALHPEAARTSYEEALRLLRARRSDAPAFAKLRARVEDALRELGGMGDAP